jgi:hypothetical protein
MPACGIALDVPIPPSMPDANHPPSEPAPTSGALQVVPSGAEHTDKLVREAWRHYYVARLAEAQFGPDSLEASLAHSRALTSYRELRGSLREMDPHYRAAPHTPRAATRQTRHLKLVRDEPLPPAPPES